MSKDFLLDELKENKNYNNTVLALWSGQAMFEDYLASAMLTMGYDLRQNIDDLTMMDIGQNNSGTNKLIELHGKDKSLILWYTDCQVFPIVAEYRGGKLSFTLYNHESTYLKGYVDGLSEEDLRNADESVFNKLLELATEEASPLASQVGLLSYKIYHYDMLSALTSIMDDSANMTTNIGQSLTDIHELFKTGRVIVNLPSSKSEEVEGITIGHHLGQMNYTPTKSAYDKYRYFIYMMVMAKNQNDYSDGSRIVISKDLSEIEVYDDKGLSYTLPILELDSDFESYDIEYTHGEFLRWLEYNIELAKRSNKLYAELGDLKGADFTHAEVLQGKVHLRFKKTNWNTNKVVEGTIYFQLNDPGYTITFKSSVKGVSQKLKLSDEEVLVLPSSPLEFTKTVHTTSEYVAQAFHVGLYYVESAKLDDILETNGLLVQDKKN